jgi:phage terminase large subunit-like protein
MSGRPANDPVDWASDDAWVVPSAAAIDHERIRRGGLYKFVELAWPHINDPTPTFSKSKHLEVVCDVLTDLMRRELREHVLEMPPGTGKSIITGVFLPAYTWAELDPKHCFFYASNDETLLNRDSQKLIDLLRSEWFVERWGTYLPDTAVGVSNFVTLKDGRRFNTSFGGRGVGWHAHTQIIDDPIKPKDAEAISGIALESAWRTISQTYASRAISAETFARLIVMQPLADGDPADRAVKEAGWSKTTLPMQHETDNRDPRDWRTEEGQVLDPARFPPDALARLKRNVSAAGVEVWETQYQMRRSVAGGSIIKADWIDAHKFGAAERERVIKTPGTFLQSWDLTFKDAESSDFVAGQWWKSIWIDNEEHFFLLDALHARLSFLETVGTMRARRKLWRTGVIVIENKANGPACESVFRREWPGVIELYEPKDSKPARLAACQVEWSEGRVHIFEGLPALDGETESGFDRLKRAITKFPRVRRDDEVDAASQALAHYRDANGYIGRLRRALRR